MFNIIISSTVIILFYIQICYGQATTSKPNFNPETDCIKSNGSCGVCVQHSDCAFCEVDQTCGPYTTILRECTAARVKFLTCTAVGNAKVLLIVLCSVGGVVLLGIIVIICCICRRCNKRAQRKEIQRQDKDRAKTEERKAAQEVRAAERKNVTDQIRMKYGILKKNENNEYKPLP
ncbi:unnamed protein product [Didymodactylos carnosus]|uniref:PTTG1IP n=1 Tax=Didymodactylos carnosus TaxID=1234261 RepID=A0A8S2CPY7_9BILA|nr:unnamed protein product [Didymodactylos carnosus]CAF3554948.1 unnamed protein product [Didymodactylos carnosus]